MKFYKVLSVDFSYPVSHIIAYAEGVSARVSCVNRHFVIRETGERVKPLFDSITHSIIGFVRV